MTCTKIRVRVERKTKYFITAHLIAVFAKLYSIYKYSV